MILFPAIDLRAGCCVRLTQGLADGAKVYDNDPVRVAISFQQQGAAWLHVVDLDAAMERASNNRQVIRNILTAVEIPVQVGGGLRTLAGIEEVLRLGAARVILGSMAVEHPERLRSALNRWGDRIAVGVDAKSGKVSTHGWKQMAAQGPFELAQRLERQGVERIIYTDIQRDGSLGGPALDSTLALARSTQMRVIASGGVGTLEDLRSLKRAGQGILEGVVVGKAFYEGRFTLSAALEALSCP